MLFRLFKSILELLDSSDSDSPWDDVDSLSSWTTASLDWR